MFLVHVPAATLLSRRRWSAAGRDNVKLPHRPHFPVFVWGSWGPLRTWQDRQYMVLAHLPVEPGKCWLVAGVGQEELHLPSESWFLGARISS